MRSTLRTAVSCLDQRSSLIRKYQFVTAVEQCFVIRGLFGK
jgi:hypothetical protein